MTELQPAFDVIVVGGRVAGATLAARLGARGIHVLVVDRAELPSLPQVPSSPTVHPGAMRILDELGIDESGYADEHARMPWFAFELGDHVSTEMKIPSMFGRDYFYGVDRRRFDGLLWDRLDRFPTVERRQGDNVTSLLRAEDGRVEGVVIRRHGEAEEQVRARCVVGADGRFSAVARFVEAPIVEEDAEHVSTVYYADWEAVAPFREGLHGGHIHSTGKGLDVLLFAMPDGRFSINTHERADRVHVDGDPVGYYEGTLRRIPRVWRRLQGARRVSDVIGIKRIGNAYRQASGDGWVLVGDALHSKDPVDGQGIYDALVAARALDTALAAWLAGAATWTDAMRAYEAEVRAETHAMFRATCDRLRRELYQEPPALIAKTVIRWSMTDPAYQREFFRLLGRDMRAEDWPPKGLVGGAIRRGLRRDAGRTRGSDQPAEGTRAPS